MSNYEALGISVFAATTCSGSGNAPGASGIVIASFLGIKVLTNWGSALMWVSVILPKLVVIIVITKIFIVEIGINLVW